LKRIFLHIGQHKTGTTSIQNFCSKNRDALQDCGYKYPGKKLSHHYVAKWLKEEKQLKLNKFFKRLSKHPQNNTVISSESFSKLEDSKWEVLKNQIDAAKLDPILIFYLRRQDKAIESIYTQMLKNGKIKVSIQDFVDGRKFPNLQYADFVKKLSAIFGEDKLIVASFEHAKQNLLKHFLSQLEIAESDFSKFKFINKNKNSKPSIDDLQSILDSNKIKMDIHHEGDKYQLLNKKERQNLLSTYKADNEYLAQNFSSFKISSFEIS